MFEVRKTKTFSIYINCLILDPMMETMYISALSLKEKSVVMKYFTFNLYNIKNFCMYPLNFNTNIFVIFML